MPWLPPRAETIDGVCSGISARTRAEEAQSRVKSRFEQRVVERTTALSDDLATLEHRRIRRHHAPLSLLLNDEDHVMRLNDADDHDAIGRIVEALATLRMRSFRDSDARCRYDGEAFG